MKIFFINRLLDKIDSKDTKNTYIDQKMHLFQISLQFNFSFIFISLYLKVGNEDMICSGINGYLIYKNKCYELLTF
ncbi:hypothetical protein HMPREF9012_2093 [Bacteroidetes bacterium oral taxon 272 str. F0290]|nr:hypothetical protein HMPREF9012_2093 [Bacteroidetes bacterium oral taxon 272 str. F0290]